MKKIIFISIFIGFLYNSTFSQSNVNFSWGPVLYLNTGFYNINNYSASFNPSFGVSIQNKINYLFSIKGALLYSYKSISNKAYGDSSRLGQFIDIPFGLKFSDYYDAEKKYKPYFSLLYVNSIKISESINSNEESLLNSYIPGFIINVGTEIKLNSIFSHADLSIGYYRAFSNIYKIDNVKSNLNQISIGLGFWF